MVPTTKSKANLGPNYATQSDDAKYRSKYRELKMKTKDLEEENNKMSAKIMAARRQINRLRLERSILYDRLSTSHNAMLPWVHPSKSPYQMDHLDPSRLPTIEELGRREKDRPKWETHPAFAALTKKERESEAPQQMQSMHMQQTSQAVQPPLPPQPQSIHPQTEIQAQPPQVQDQPQIQTQPQAQTQPQVPTPPQAPSQINSQVQASPQTQAQLPPQAHVQTQVQPEIQPQVTSPRPQIQSQAVASQLSPQPVPEPVAPLPPSSDAAPA